MSVWASECEWVSARSLSIKGVLTVPFPQNKHRHRHRRTRTHLGTGTLGSANEIKILIGAAEQRVCACEPVS